MRILSLTISDVRGIRDLTLTMNGGNVVVFGRNGSGKSGVVDAIDFLLTGKISRLIGAGTDRITLEAHGRHVDGTPESAVVSATVEVAGWDGPVVLTRTLAQPRALGITPAEATSAVDPMIALASRGQHVLTRRQILDYITTTAGNRAEQIQKLLGMEDVPAVRLVLVKAAKAARAEAVNAQRAVDSARGRIAACLDRPGSTDAVLLERANELLAAMEAPPIVVLAADSLAQLPEVPTQGVSTARQVLTALNALQPLLAAQAGNTETNAAVLFDDVGHLGSDPELLRSLSCSELLRLGLDLLDDSGLCPLCGHEWPADVLEDRLRGRWAQCEEAGEIQQRISEMARQIRSAFSTVLAQVEEVQRRVEIANLDDERAWLATWAADLRRAQDILASPVSRRGELTSDIASMLAPSQLAASVSRVEVRAVAEAEDTASQALAQLAGAREALASLDDATAGLQSTIAGQGIAEALLGAFETARDEVFSELFNTIVGRFTALYRRLHGEDEEQFEAALELDGAGMQMDVDFYGRGMLPIGSVHSEGHLDSMGICLFLALNEYLSGDALEIIVLDDVVMSVDRGHRRAFAELLAEEFSSRQVVITTHEDDWAMQLQTTGVVTREGSFRFSAWDVETGPQVEVDADIWTSIERDMAAEQVGAAAQKLRRWGEYFFASSCDLLGAAVPFHLDGSWNLGEVLLAAEAKLRRYLTRAEAGARDDETRTIVRARLDELQRAFLLTRAEQWVVNAEVHYNTWADLSPEDFRPVVQALQELAVSFVCPDCGAQLSLVRGRPDVLQCRCANVLWAV